MVFYLFLNTNAHHHYRLFWVSVWSLLLLGCSSYAEKQNSLESTCLRFFQELSLEVSAVVVEVDSAKGVMGLSCHFLPPFYLGDAINKEILTYVVWRLDSLLPANPQQVNFHYTLEGLSGSYHLYLERGELTHSPFITNETYPDAFRWLTSQTNAEDIIAFNMMIEDLEQYTELSFTDLPCPQFICFLRQYAGAFSSGPDSTSEKIEHKMDMLIKAARYPKAPHKPEVLVTLRAMIRGE